MYFKDNGVCLSRLISNSHLSPLYYFQQTQDPATVTVEDDELTLVDTCYVKV